MNTNLKQVDIIIGQYYFYGKLLVAQSCVTLCDPRSRFFCPWDFPGKNTGVGSISFSRGNHISKTYKRYRNQKEMCQIHH